MNKMAALFLNGIYAETEPRLSLIDRSTVIIGVDGGTRYLMSVNHTPDVVIGDMDSLSLYKRTQLSGKGIHMLPYPTDKDQTDFELAIDYAISQGCDHIMVFGGLYGRMDHMLANLLLPLAYKDRVMLHFVHGLDDVFFIRQKAIIEGTVGDIVSLIPISDKVTGIHTTGLHYPLEHETLYAGQSRGVSNLLDSAQAEISIRSGRLLCIHLSRSSSNHDKRN